MDNAIEGASNFVMDKFAGLIRKRPDRRILVYCMAKATVNDVALRLREGLKDQANVLTFTGDLSAQEKAGIVETFLSTEADRPVVAVGTSALGAGIDHPSVVAVLHVGGQWGMPQLAQEAGRAGRGEGTDALHVVFWDKHHDRLLRMQADGQAQTHSEPPPDAAQRLHAQQALEYIHNDASCFRFLMDDILTGRSGIAIPCLYEPSRLLLCGMCESASQRGQSQDGHELDADGPIDQRGTTFWKLLGLLT